MPVGSAVADDLGMVFFHHDGSGGSVLDSNVQEHTAELGLKRMVTEQDIRRINQVATEMEVDALTDYIHVHFDDDIAEMQQYEADLLSWCNAVLQVNNINVTNFHRSWWDGTALCMLVKATIIHRKDALAMDSLDEHIDVREDDPVATLAEAVRRAEDALNVDLGFDPVELIRCRNRHCKLRGSLRHVEHGNKEIALCQSCRPDEQEVLQIVGKLRDKWEDIRVESGAASLLDNAGNTAKSKLKRNRYNTYRKAGLMRLVDAFGLTGEEVNLTMA